MMRKQFHPCGSLVKYAARSLSYSASGPSKPVTSWESGAKKVKNIDVTNPYLENIREVHDPSQHLKTIEEELLGTMGKALGRQGEKVLNAIRLMHSSRQEYEQLRRNSHNHPEIPDCIKRHNEYRKQAHTARWELIVHRQAIGMIVDNHKYVMDTFPIGDPLPLNDDPSDHKKNKPEKEKKQFGDQLDWWKRVGRWR